MARTNTHKRTQMNRVLIEMRLDRGWYPNDLARIARVSGNTVRAAERGEYVDPRSQYAIAAALEVPRVVVFPFDRQREAL